MTEKFDKVLSALSYIIILLCFIPIIKDIQYNYNANKSTENYILTYTTCNGTSGIVKYTGINYVVIRNTDTSTRYGRGLAVPELIYRTNEKYERVLNVCDYNLTKETK